VAEPVAYGTRLSLADVLGAIGLIFVGDLAGWLERLASALMLGGAMAVVLECPL
jgi:hypothetical protein